MECVSTPWRCVLKSFGWNSAWDINYFSIDYQNDLYCIMSCYHFSIKFKVCIPTSITSTSHNQKYSIIPWHTSWTENYFVRVYLGVMNILPCCLIHPIIPEPCCYNNGIHKHSVMKEKYLLYKNTTCVCAFSTSRTHWKHHHPFLGRHCHGTLLNVVHSKRLYAWQSASVPVVFPDPRQHHSKSMQYWQCESRGLWGSGKSQKNFK